MKRGIAEDLSGVERRRLSHCAAKPRHPCHRASAAHAAMVGDAASRIRRGDPAAARLRVSIVQGLAVLDRDPRADALAAAILRSSVLPANATADAMHIAIATVNGMDFLVTWNCRHIANGFVLRRIVRLSRDLGLEPPIVVTPEELMEGDYVGRSGRS